MLGRPGSGFGGRGGRGAAGRAGGTGFWAAVERIDHTAALRACHAEVVVSALAKPQAQP